MAGDYDTDREDILKLSSVPLRMLGEDGRPRACASGCLIDYRGQRFLLSVSHATKPDENWAVEVCYEPGKGTRLYQLGAMSFIKEADLRSRALTDVDFAYVVVPPDLTPLLQNMTPDGRVISAQPRRVLQLDFSVTPKQNDSYGFAGLVLPELVPSATGPHEWFFSEQVTYDSLRYMGSEEGFHTFRLPIEHPGHEYFEGCSGAPIIDSKRNLVALVTHGGRIGNTIYGVALNEYRVALDIEVQTLSRDT